MNRPHIICHMVTSMDGKNGANGFICGRVTMESSFTGGWYPDLTKYEPIEKKEDYIPDNKKALKEITEV